MDKVESKKKSGAAPPHSPPCGINDPFLISEGVFMMLNSKKERVLFSTVSVSERSTENVNGDLRTASGHSTLTSH